MNINLEPLTNKIKFIFYSADSLGKKIVLVNDEINHLQCCHGERWRLSVRQQNSSHVILTLISQCLNLYLTLLPAVHTCPEIYQLFPGSLSGYYTILVSGTPIEVFCDMSESHRQGIVSKYKHISQVTALEMLTVIATR